MQAYFDRFAILLSGACAIHCILFPLIAIFIPFLTTIQHGHTFHEFWFHQFILIFILPISLVALYSGYRYHRKWIPILVSMTGLSILTLNALFAGHMLSLHIIPHEAETLVTIAGGIVHAVGHIYNMLETQKTHNHSSDHN
jgi:hypothetical protein|tara:strand:+ start:50 stop:472 length:423 start_codon:yes stop_codon:yes gene_type:complete